MRESPGSKPNFSETDLNAIRRMLEADMTQADIAHAFSCNQSTISRVIAKNHLDYAHNPETPRERFLAKVEAHASGDHSHCGHGEFNGPCFGRGYANGVAFFVCSHCESRFGSQDEVKDHHAQAHYDCDFSQGSE